MPDGRDVIYLFDGTFDGLLCCVYESYIRRETPMDILPNDAPQLTLCQMREIVTLPENAHRVFVSLSKLGAEACDLIDNAFLSSNVEKDFLIFQFICLGYREGPKAADMLGNDVVSAIHKLSLAVWHESHMLMGFIRFSDYSGALVAVIEPKHNILPLLVSHFCERYSGERFLIFDKARGMALVYQPYEWRIVPVEEFSLPHAGETELQYRGLWTQYFRTIAIESRANPRCQMSHMPKRFWKHLTEMQTLSSPATRAGDKLKQQTLPHSPEPVNKKGRTLPGAPQS